MKIESQIMIFIFLSLFLSLGYAAGEINVTDITLNPTLDITYFNSYNVTANVSNSTPIDKVIANISGVNGEAIPCWDFYVNGTCANNQPHTFFMGLLSGKTYWVNYIRPDHIYPQITFADDYVTWMNVPQETSLYRQNYHVFNFTNSFTPAPNMTFFIEFDTEPTSVSSSSVLTVYLIGNGENLTYFESDWRTKPNTELVGTISRTQTKHHTHTANSSHYLIPLTADANGTFGINNINITGDFWVVLYQDSSNTGNGWDLRYRGTSLCNNTYNWFVASITGGTWNTPTQEDGCPDVHIHLARRVTIIDGVNVTVFANQSDGNSTVNSSLFTFAPLPNLPPSRTIFIQPNNTAYKGFLNITWLPSIDPNGDVVTYNLSLLNVFGPTMQNRSFNQTLNGSTTLNYFNWNTSTVNDGPYDLMVEACDTSSACVNWTMGELYDSSVEPNNFLIDNLPPIIFIHSPTNTTYNYSKILVNISTDDMSDIWFNWNGTNFTYENDTVFYPNGVNVTFPDGTYTLDVWANSSLGNMNYTNVTFTVDTIPPYVAIVSPVNMIYNTTSILINITNSSDAHTVWFFNGTANETYTAPKYINVPGDGTYTLDVWANDSVNNINYTNVTFTVDTIPPFIAIISPVGPYNTTNILVNITIAPDAHTVWFTNETGGNETYTAPTYITKSDGGPYVLHAWVNDSVGNVNYTNSTYGVDTIPPYFTTIPANQSIVYGTVWIGVDFDATDSGIGFDSYAVDDARFTINSSGYLNATVLLGAGNYYLNVSVNDSLGNTNFTMYNLNVTQNNSVCDVYFNTSSPVTYPETFEVYTNCNTAYTLMRNGTPITNASIQALAAGTYNFTVIRTDQQNYSNVYDEEHFTVDKNNAACDVYFNTPSPVTYPETFEVYTNCNTAYNLLRNGTPIANTSIQALAAGAYNFTVIRTDQQNYSNIIDTEFFTVDKNNAACDVMFTNSTTGALLAWNNVTFPGTFNVTTNCNTLYTLLRNGTGIVNNTEQILAAGLYNFTVMRTDTQNYSNVYDEENFTVNKAQSIVETHVRGVRKNINIAKGTTISLNSTLILGEGPIKLYLNGTLINQGMSPIGNSTKFNDLGEFDVTTAYEETENYTASNETWVVTVKRESSGSSKDDPMFEYTFDCETYVLDIESESNLEVRLMSLEDYSTYEGETDIYGKLEFNLTRDGKYRVYTDSTGQFYSMQEDIELVCEEIVEEEIPEEIEEEEEELNQTEEISLDEILEIEDLIREVENEIQKALDEGKDVTEAQRVLQQAKDAFDEGNYELAKELATQALILALDAQAQQPVTDDTEIGAEVEEPGEEETQQKPFNWIPIILGAIVGIVIVGTLVFFGLKILNKK